jgi:hypothetical protein
VRVPETEIGRLVIDEVRTRRLVVVDDAGRPRVTVTVERGTASVRVDAPDGDPSVELYAVGPVDADAAEAGIALFRSGDAVTTTVVFGPDGDGA